jgi:hypothetical protein
VVGKCANPECGVPFRYFHEGKLFRFDLSVRPMLVRVQSDREIQQRIEDFWLCGSCASKMTLTLEDGVTVALRPLVHSMASFAASVEIPSRPASSLTLPGRLVRPEKRIPADGLT